MHDKFLYKMQFLIYIIIYPILILVSILPFRILYILSDLLYIIVYYIIGYRKNVVRDNLALTLPHLSQAERKIIEKKSYSHLCDMFLEMIKTMTISKNEIYKRYYFANLDFYKSIEAEKKSIILMCGHYASYEWLVSLNQQVAFKGFGVYKKINNPYFDQLVKKIRARFGATLISTKETIPTIIENVNNNVLSLYGFASDQSPTLHNAVHWTKFLGVEVPIHVGAESLAKKYDLNILFLKTIKVKRGHYVATFERLSDTILGTPDYQISDLFIKKVEHQIYEAPEFYLWTHKRWKHRRA
ncbi:lysophospholipid acyltransferase family protein [Flavobacterium branchiophilum]